MRRHLATPEADDAGAQQFQSLQARSLDLLRREEETELAAHEAVERLRRRIIELNGDCGSLLLGSLDQHEDNLEGSRTHELLLAALPAGQSAAHSLSLDNVLRILEHEREDVRVALSGCGGPQEPDTLWALREETAALEGEVWDAEASAKLKKEEADSLLEKAATVAASESALLGDLLSEASSLRRESGLRKRQQAEWQRSQVRMLRLVEDLHSQRAKSTSSQAASKQVVPEKSPGLPTFEEGLHTATTDARIRATSPGGQFEKLQAENSALQQQIRGLEREKAELLRKKQELVSFVNSQMLQLQETFGYEVGLAASYPANTCYPPSP